MYRQLKWSGSFLLAIFALGPLDAQSQGRKPEAQAQNARWQRMRREQAVSYVGPVARGLVETFGDDACRALAACSPGMGCRLAALFNSGTLEREIPRPRELLAAIGTPGAGDVVAWWALQHLSELRDIDACDAFLRDPVSYSLHLKSLEAGTAEMRALRLLAATGKMQPQAIEDSAMPILVSGGLILAGLALWWKRRRQRAQFGA